MFLLTLKGAGALSFRGTFRSATSISGWTLLSRLNNWWRSTSSRLDNSSRPTKRSSTTHGFRPSYSADAGTSTSRTRDESGRASDAEPSLRAEGRHCTCAPIPAGPSLRRPRLRLWQRQAGLDREPHSRWPAGRRGLDVLLQAGAPHVEGPTIRGTLHRSWQQGRPTLEGGIEFQDRATSRRRRDRG